MHEARMHRHNQFVTLTYSDEELPRDLQLRPKHLQDFLKRLRKAVEASKVASDNRVRFFACGEYGGKTFRPHYHAILFDCRFPDAIKASVDLQQSDVLDKLWGFGACRIAPVTAASAQYVAMYSVKKMDIPKCDPDGVVIEPPFVRMSRRPGVGASWLDGFAGDLKEGFMVVDGQRVGIPRAYVQRLAKMSPGYADEVKFRQSELGRRRPPVSCERLQVQERVKELKVKRQREREFL